METHDGTARVPFFMGHLVMSVENKHQNFSVFKVHVHLWKGRGGEVGGQKKGGVILSKDQGDSNQWHK